MHLVPTGFFAQLALLAGEVEHHWVFSSPALSDAGQLSAKRHERAGFVQKGAGAAHANCQRATG